MYLKKTQTGKERLKNLDMPVGWMWFLGVSAFYVGYIRHSVPTLVQNAGMSGYAEG